MLNSEVNGTCSVPLPLSMPSSPFVLPPRVPQAPFQQILLSGKDLKDKFTLMSKEQTK